MTVTLPIATSLEKPDPITQRITATPEQNEQKKEPQRNETEGRKDLMYVAK